MKFSLSEIAYTLLTLICAVVILIYTEALLIPVIMALIIWFLIKGIRKTIARIRFVREKFPIWLQSTMAFLIINLIVVVLIDMLVVNMEALSQSIQLYEANIQNTVEKLNSSFGIELVSKMDNFMEGFEFTGLVSSLINVATAFFGDAFLIPLYVLFLLIEEKVFAHKLHAIYKDEQKFNKARAILDKIDKSISQYLTLKTLVSLLTGFLSYLALVVIGIDAPVFWAILIFIMNFIPTIGSLIATLFPAGFALLQFGEFGPFFYVLGAVGTVQVIVGNIIEPKLMGNSLNISSFVVMIALAAWGSIWGIMGMVLSVPITVMMIIIFSEVPSTQFIAIMLSEKGDLHE